MQIILLLSALEIRFTRGVFRFGMRNEFSVRFNLITLSSHHNSLLVALPINTIHSSLRITIWQALWSLVVWFNLEFLGVNFCLCLCFVCAFRCCLGLLFKFTRSHEQKWQFIISSHHRHCFHLNLFLIIFLFPYHGRYIIVFYLKINHLSVLSWWRCLSRYRRVEEHGCCVGLSGIICQALIVHLSISHYFFRSSISEKNEFWLACVAFCMWLPLRLFLLLSTCWKELSWRRLRPVRLINHLIANLLLMFCSLALMLFVGIDR